MTDRRIDLHAHSTASDGTTPPAEVMARAAAAGLDVIALTDHDTQAGLPEALASLPRGLTLVPGAEISCAVGGSDSGGTSLHLLGYLFDPAEPTLARELELLRTDRTRRGEAMVRRVRELGADVSWERVRELAARGSVGRPHVARALVEAGVVPSVKAAFSPEWIGSGGRAYVNKYALDPHRAISLVRAAGGVPVFAHPGAASRGPVVDDDEIASMAAAGLGGLEVDHPDHDPATRLRLRRLADELGLFVTGSSDDHGEITGYRLGVESTAEQAYEALLAQATGATPLRSSS
ncbi:MAG: PHP domain-containing protein [Actinomycetota bacterium]|nr:PHP domain-containing protein [Actinomycetota bacterium]